MSFEEILISKTPLYDFYIRVHEMQVEMQSELSNYEGKEKWLSDSFGMQENI